MEHGVNMDWDELPVRMAHHLFRCIGIRGVRIDTVEAPLTTLQRLFYWTTGWAKPQHHYLTLDLDVARFPIGAEIGDVYYNNWSQRYIIVNLSQSGSRVKLKSLEPSPAPQVLCKGDWAYLYTSNPKRND